MRTFRLLLAAMLAAGCPLAAQEQNSEVLTVGADKFLRWYGHADRTYFIQVSDPNDHLRKWTWAPIIETGNAENISYEVDGTADKGFFRLWFSDQPTNDPDGDDFDGDGLSNLDEITLYQTNPLTTDTDGDGLLDGWEVANSLDPNDDGTTDPDNGGSGDPDNDGLTNSEEQDLGTDPNDADSDGDGITDGGENDQGTDPNDSEDTPDAEWFILTGDLNEDEVKTRSRTVTIPAGQSRVIAVVVASEEYPDWTGDGSEFNDTLEWDIQPSEGDALQGSIDVNSRHGEWEEAETLERECKGFSPAHVETGMTLTAPDNAALTIDIELSATNIGDGTLPSTVLVGILPVIPVEFFPQLLDGDGVAIAGSENPRTAPGETNGMTEENPVANRMAHREMQMRIVDGEVLEGKELTWTMDPLYVHPDQQNPAFRGAWTHSTNHNTYFETSAHYGAYDFAVIAAQPTPVSATTTIDESAESAIRINLPPVGFNQGRVRIAVEDFQGDPAKVADMEVPAVIVIDPGHGGTDSGAVGSDGTTLEKNLTLSYALDLQTELRDQLDDLAPFHRVLITRNADVDLALAGRPPVARDAGADVFASVHFNSGPPAARGTETFVERTEAESIATGDPANNPGDNHNVAQDENLATPVNTGTFDAVAASDANANNRGVQHAGKYVTRDLYLGNVDDYFPVRACLIEVEFLSNAAALASLNGANAATIRAAFAENIAEAIVEDIESQPNP